MREIDDDKLGLLLKQTGGMVAASFNCAITVLGDRLGLYQALGELGPSTGSELALHLELHERWVREWLHQKPASANLNILPMERGLLSRRRPMRCWPMRIIRPISWADSIPRSRYFPR